MQKGGGDYWGRDPECHGTWGGGDFQELWFIKNEKKSKEGNDCFTTNIVFATKLNFSSLQIINK